MGNQSWAFEKGHDDLEIADDFVELHDEAEENEGGEEQNLENMSSTPNDDDVGEPDLVGECEEFEDDGGCEVALDDLF